jgi:hypothetical protein
MTDIPTTQIKPYQYDWYTVLLPLFFFCPFQHPEPRAPCPKSAAENPFYQTTIMNYLLLPRDLECDQAYISLIVPYITMTELCYIHSIYAVHSLQAVASTIRGHWAAYIVRTILQSYLATLKYRHSFIYFFDAKLGNNTFGATTRKFLPHCS